MALIHVTNPSGQGPTGLTGPQGPQGPAGNDGISPNLLAVTTDIVPVSDNTKSLGSDSNRFKSVHIGPGTIYITDQTLGTNAGLTVNNGVLQINGANQLQVGQLKFVDNTIESTTSSINIQIGATGDSATIELNRNTHIPTGKKITYGTGRRVDIEPSLAPYGKQTVCVVTSGSKKQMYWGTCSSQGLTGDEYYVLATFTTS